MKIEKLVSETNLKEIALSELVFLAKERPLKWEGMTFDKFGDSALVSDLIELNRVRFAKHAFPPPTPWSRIKSQIYILFCTKEPMYAPLRKQLKSSGKHTETTIVSMVAAGVATHLGLAMGALVPFCALCLLGILKIGQGAYCEKVKLEIPIDEKAPKKRPITKRKRTKR